MKKQSKIM